MAPTPITATTSRPSLMRAASRSRVLESWPWKNVPLNRESMRKARAPDTIQHYTVQRLKAEFDLVWSSMTMGQAKPLTWLPSRMPAKRPIGAGRGVGDPYEDQGGNRPQCLRQHLLQQLASDHRKPNRQYVITPEMGPGVCRSPGGRQIPRHRARNHSQCMALASTRARYAQSVARVHAG